ncbi:hypothetical protein Ae201684P_017332 [Aphanomyces euteiches]|nr:hypothetical protein Ae201684P_017332 [Aphanomyces euteiches]
MLLHVIIAFAIVINPAFYILEGWILGLHKHTFAEVPEVENGFVSSSTPIEKDVNGEMTVVENNDLHDLDAKTYQQPGVYPRSQLFALFVVACVAIACVWKDSLSDLLDFAGFLHVALQYDFADWVLLEGELAKDWHSREDLMRACDPRVSLLGWRSGPAPWDSVKFPYCPAGSSYQRIVYTNVSYHANFTRTTTL